MPTTDTQVSQLIINRLTKTQFEGVSPSRNELWAVDLEFSGNKLLATDGNGEIVESSDVPTTIQALSATDSITLADAVLYQGGEQTSLTIALPASATVGFISQITFKSGATATSLTYPNTLVWNNRGEDVIGGVFTPVANKVYTVIVIYDGYQFVGFTEGV